jgi:hypothetical protein
LSIQKALKALEVFQGDSLTASLASIEAAIAGSGQGELKAFCQDRCIDNSLMESALTLKKVAGQINVVIHAAGILCSLPHILEPGEQVLYVSLGAGNTGRRFDLETNIRVAEYKFIDWRGGPESIRQNSLFKDFFYLAEHETKKRKFIYVIGTDKPNRFLNGRRALTSVLSRYPTILDRIRDHYGKGVITVRDYYQLKSKEVEIVDVSPYVGRVA